MARFGLIGNPIAHSKSPALFKAAYSGEDSYELIEAESLEASMDKFLNSDFKGINVTSPYKDVVMQYVSCPDRVSALLGSANVLLKGDANGKVEIFSKKLFVSENESQDRTFVVVEKVEKTPDSYPRMYSKIKNKPL